MAWYGNKDAVQGDFARQLERERNEARDQLARICKEGFGNDDTIGLEPADDYVLRQVAKMRGVMARLCRAVSRRMMPDDPTPEDRMELREAFDAAFSILHNAEAMIDEQHKL